MKSLPVIFRSLLALVVRRPRTVFWAFVSFHLVVLSLLSWLSSPNVPLDVIEGYAWGHEWLLGTYKHPPMQAWCLEILSFLTGHAAWAPFLASQIAVVVAFWAVWNTGRDIVGETQALIGVLLLEGVLYYNFTSTEFNPNVLQLAFWALAARSFHRGVKNNRLSDWLLLGLWAAGGLYSKYSTILLLGVFAFLVAARPEARRCLKKPGPYAALLVAFTLFLPHLIWLVHYDFLPFIYVKERLHAGGPATRFVTPPAFFPNFLLSPIVFTIAQLLICLPALLLLLVLHSEPNPKATPIAIDKFDRPFLAAITFAPMTMTLLLAIAFGFKIHDMWGAPFFNFAGLWALVKYYPKGARVEMRFASAWVIVFVGALVMYVGGNCLTPYINHQAMRVDFPGAALSQRIVGGWHKHYAAPLNYVIGDTWPAGNVAYYARERPHVFVFGDAAISTWIDPEDVKRKGGVLVWNTEHKTLKGEAREVALHQKYPLAEIQPSIEIPQQTGADLAPVIIGWAILPPS